MGADGEEGGIEFSRLHLLEDVVDLAVQLDRDTHVDDPTHLGFKYFARQTVLGDAEAHHAAHVGAGVHHGDGVAEAAQVVGGGHARGAGADDEHLLAGFLSGRDELPAAFDRLVAEKALDRIDAHGLVHLRAVAGPFAGVVADAAHGGRERVVLDELAPGLLVVARFGMEQPGLDVFPGRALMVARRQAVDVNGSGVAPRAGVVDQGTAHVKGDGERLLHADGPQKGWQAWGRAGSQSSSSSRP